MRYSRFAAILFAVLIAAAPMLAITGAEVLKKVKKQVAPDSRQVVYELEFDGSTGATGVLRGVTSEASALQATVDALNAAGIAFDNQAVAYPADNFGLVTIPVATLRTRPAHAGEVATQAVMGTPVRILENKKGWMRIQTPDGYIAYVPDSSIASKSKAEMRVWQRDTTRLVVTNLRQVYLTSTPGSNNPRQCVSELCLSSIVTVKADAAADSLWVCVQLPNGRYGWAERSNFTPINQWANQDLDIDLILDTAYSMEGAPYLWGGTSNKCTDCSGLVKISYLNNGIILRRDASQQALTGQRLGTDWAEYEAGDLLFFGDAAKGKVTHVGIYDSDSRYIHCSGRVKRNSLDPSASDYLYSTLWAVRIRGKVGTNGITRVADHPWFF